MERFALKQSDISLHLEKDTLFYTILHATHTPLLQKVLLLVIRHIHTLRCLDINHQQYYMEEVGKMDGYRGKCTFKQDCLFFYVTKTSGCNTGAFRLYLEMCKICSKAKWQCCKLDCTRYWEEKNGRGHAETPVKTRNPTLYTRH